MIINYLSQYDYKVNMIMKNKSMFKVKLLNFGGELEQKQATTSPEKVF